MYSLAVLEAKNPKVVWQGPVPSASSRGEPVALPLLVSSSCLLSLASSSALHLQAQQCSIFQSFSPTHSASVVTIPLTLTCLLSSYKDPGDYTGPTWIGQPNRSISRSLTSPICHVSFAMQGNILSGAGAKDVAICGSHYSACHSLLTAYRQAEEILFCCCCSTQSY